MLFRAVDTLECIKKKSQFALKYLEGPQDFATRLVAFACVEGIQFSSSFATIYWLKSRGILPGVTFSNDLIARDEGMHCRFSILLYSNLVHKLSNDSVRAIIGESVEIEKQFIEDSMPNTLPGLNRNDMKQYVEFVGDYICSLFRVDKKYGARNPFPFMEAISLEGKNNFFERRVSEYQKAVDKSISENSFNAQLDF